MAFVKKSVDPPCCSFTDCLERMVKKAVIENPNKARGILLETDDVYERRMRKRFTEFFTPLKEMLNNGTITLRENLERISKQDPENFPELALQELDKLNKGTKELEESPQNFQVTLTGMQSLAEYYGLDEEILAVYYKVAEKLIEEKSYSDALQVLYVLVGIQPEVSSYWISLGFLYYTLENYPEALAAYGFATLYDPADLTPYFYSIHCYLNLNELKNAHELVQIARTIITETPELASEWGPKLEALQGALHECD